MSEDKRNDLQLAKVEHISVHSWHRLDKEYPNSWRCSSSF